MLAGSRHSSFVVVQYFQSRCACVSEEFMQCSKQLVKRGKGTEKISI